MSNLNLPSFSSKPFSLALPFQILGISLSIFLGGFLEALDGQQ